MELTDRVLIDNLCAWPLYFRRANGVGDVMVPANARGFAQLDVAEVQTQIQLGSVFFLGNGKRPGDHARLYIVNDEQRKSLLGLDDSDQDVTVLTVDRMKELLAIRKKDDFDRALAELASTGAEKRMLLRVAKEAGGDEVAAWKMQKIEAVAGQVEI